MPQEPRLQGSLQQPLGLKPTEFIQAPPALSLGVSDTLQSCFLNAPLLLGTQVVSSLLPGSAYAVWKSLWSLKIPPNSTNTTPWSREWLTHPSRNKEVGSCSRRIWKWEPTAVLAPGTKISDWQKQKHVCFKELVVMGTSWPGSSELHRALHTPASPGTGPSLMPGELTFHRGGGGGCCSWVPNPLPSCPPQLEPEPEGLLPTVTQPSSSHGPATQGQAGPPQLAGFASTALDPLSAFLHYPTPILFWAFKPTDKLKE